MLNRNVGLIGAGAAGTSLLLALYQKGIKIVGVASRSIESAKRCSSLVGNCSYSSDPTLVASQADLVIIATPDQTIAPICQQIVDSTSLTSNSLYMHLSGAMTSDELAPVKKAGARTLSFHPIQAFADPLLGAQLLAGAFFCLEGETEAVTEGEAWVKLLGGDSIIIEKSQKDIYHTALSVSSNYLIVLEYLSTVLLQKAGIDPQLAMQAILPLIHGSAKNLQESGLPEALSGPISRGDIETVKKHLLALEQHAPELKAIYQLLGESAVTLAENKGKADVAGLAAIAAMMKNRE